MLVPGSLPPTFQNAETDTPQRSLNMTVNGQSGNANTTLTDGATNMNVAMPHHTVYVSPAETIDTVSITTGSMDAETGRAAGAAITVVTKSGTNTFKGSAFEFFNNQGLNADPYYFGRGAAPHEAADRAPDLRRHAGRADPAGTRCFSSDPMRGTSAASEQYAFFRVPDAALRNGDFRNALNTNGYAAAHLRSGVGEPHRAHRRPAAVPEQHDSRQSDPSDLTEAARALSAGKRRGNRAPAA